MRNPSSECYGLGLLMAKIKTVFFLLKSTHVSTHLSARGSGSSPFPAHHRLFVFGSLLLEMLHLFKQWSIHQIRAPASIIWSSGWWQLRGRNPRAGPKTGTFWGSVTALSAHHSPANHSAFLSQKSISRNFFPSQCFWTRHVPISQHCAMKHWYREDVSHHP